LTEFRDVVRNRRMTRAFAPDPIDPALVDDVVDLASRAPSAGKTQGWHVVVLEGADEVARYWDITLPTDKRASFRWQHLLDAPVLMIALADPSAYVERYAEPDKARTGLGDGAEAWPAPYWTIDTSMAVMTLLLAAEDRGLGALFFGVFQREAVVRTEFGIPDALEIVGAIALGRPREDDEPGRSSKRARRSPDQIIHRGHWQPPA
jgi:nitroreductase